MASLVPCKSCGKEVSSSAKSCPHCGHKLKGGFLKNLIFWTLGILFALMVIGAIVDEDESSVTKTSPSGGDVVSELQVGDSLQTKKFEIQVSSVQGRNHVGNEFFSAQPSEGAVYVAVRWNYKNISSKPIGPFSTPTISLVDKKGTKYEEDIAASTSLATELNLNEKILSNLNPGIRVRAAGVFEVSRETFNPETWHILIDADKNIKIKLQ